MIIKQSHFKSHQVHRISEIKFCCGNMSNDFLRGKIRILYPYINNSLNFYIKEDDSNNRFFIIFCPYCGSKIKEE